MIRLRSARHAISREPLLAPFGFKGKYVNELWQTVACLESDKGNTGLGLGVQSVLWSDPNVLARYGEQEGNELMYAITRYALDETQGAAFDTPPDFIERLLPAALKHGKELAAMPELRCTFALNALVPIDHAAWVLYGREHGMADFVDMVPIAYRPALPFRHEALASVPLVSYGMDDKAIDDMLSQGYFVIKIKLGADPDQDGDPDKMLAWDQGRLAAVHRLAGAYGTPYTENGRIAYYLDANGRYPNKEILLRFLEFANRIGALDQIVLFEEPFDEWNKIDVSDVPVRVAADESVHSLEDALERMELGYRAMALKPIAKTLSVSLQVARLAEERGVPCFCADLTVNPWMVDWNKNLAARLAPIPGLTVGLLESNGSQNYRNWERMKSYHPMGGAAWAVAQDGLYRLDEAFYTASGGVFQRSPYYESLFET